MTEHKTAAGVEREWATVPHTLTETMKQVLHNNIRIMVEPALRQATVLNDQEVWSALLAVAPSLTPEAPPIQGGEVERALSDPAAVHLNMLRGSIAKPTIAQIIHLYGEDALSAAIASQQPRARVGREEIIDLLARYYMPTKARPYAADAILSLYGEKGE